MKAVRLLILLIFIPALFVSCKKDKNDPGEDCNFDIEKIDFSFGIDYGHPEKYLVPGEQSNVSDIYLEEIRVSMGEPSMTISGVFRVCHWVNQYFTFEDAGGAMAGKNTVDELYEKRKFYGCHSTALIISSILREFGFPAVMIETASVPWGYDYRSGATQNFAGHVMTEVFVDGNWILLDNNCTYVLEYDQYNPFIFSKSPQDDYFVFAKGVDTWDYSGNDDSYTLNQLIYFSENIHCYEDMFNTVFYHWKD